MGILLVSFSAFFLSLVVDGRESELIPTPHFEVYLNNNPQLIGGFIEFSYGKQQVVNTPRLEVKGKLLPCDGVLQVTVYDKNDDILFTGKKEVKVPQGDFAEDFILDSPLSDPQYAHITFNTEKGTFENLIPIKLHKLYGKITDFEGNPIAAYLLVSGLAIRARADSDGYYTLWLPEQKVQHIFIDDETYSKTSLECYIGHEFTLTRDLNIDLHIHRLELYNMRAWSSYTAFYVYFIPMSLTRLQDTTLAGKREQWPKLSIDQVKVYINEREIPIVFFNEIPDYLGNEDTRPAYIVSIPKREARGAHEKDGYVVVRVVAEDKIEYPDRVVVDKGEAILINSLR